MKKWLSFLFLFFISTSVFSQLTKGTWLVGGSARFSKQQEKLFGSEVNSTRIELSPNLGYFFIDKFAAGVRPRLDFIRFERDNASNKSTTLGIGPFIRYYLLPIEKTTNLLVETSYQYLSAENGFSQNLFTVSGGPVIYFNSSVGLEFTLNYEMAKSNASASSSKNLFFGIGFQIHLAK